MPSYSSEQQKVSFLTEPDFQVFVPVPPLTLHVTLDFEPPKTLHKGRQTKLNITSMCKIIPKL